MRARLFAKTGPFAGQSFEIGSEATLGRSEQNQIVLHDKLVSSQHVRVFWDPEQECYLVEDLGSLNGTQVDGVQVREPEKLGALSVLTLAGAHDFIFQVVQERAAPSPAVAPETAGTARGTPAGGGPGPATRIESFDAFVLPELPEMASHETAPRESAPRESAGTASGTVGEGPRPATRIESFDAFVLPELPEMASRETASRESAPRESAPRESAGTALGSTGCGTDAAPGGVALQREGPGTVPVTPLEKAALRQARTTSGETAGTSAGSASAGSASACSASAGSASDDRERSPRFALRVERPGRPVHFFELPPGEYQVGRTSDTDIAIDDPTLSRAHARLRVVAGRVWVQDLGSTNQTLVAGQEVRGEVELVAGDELTFGAVPARLIDRNARGMK